MNSVIDINDARSALNYDPLTGAFTWRAARGSVKSGARAGTIGRNGYVQIKVAQRLWYAHRLAWAFVHEGPMPRLIDHANRIRSDNRIENLRAASFAENRVNSDRILGASFHKASGLWHARIKVDGQLKFSRYFATQEEASAAYATAIQEFFPGFAP